MIDLLQFVSDQACSACIVLLTLSGVFVAGLSYIGYKRERERQRIIRRIKGEYL